MPRCRCTYLQPAAFGHRRRVSGRAATSWIMIPTHTRTYGRAIHAPRGVRTHMILRRVIGCVRCLDEHTQHSETAWEEIWGHLGAVESRPVRTEMTAERLIARRAGPGKTGRRGRQDGLRRAHLWAVTTRRGGWPGMREGRPAGAGSSGAAWIWSGEAGGRAYQ